MIVTSQYSSVLAVLYLTATAKQRNNSREHFALLPKSTLYQHHDRYCIRNQNRYLNPISKSCWLLPTRIANSRTLFSNSGETPQLIRTAIWANTGELVMFHEKLFILSLVLSLSISYCFSPFSICSSLFLSLFPFPHSYNFPSSLFLYSLSVWYQGLTTPQSAIAAIICNIAITHRSNWLLTEITLAKPIWRTS